MDHADAVVEGVLRGGNGHGCVVDVDLAFVGVVYAGKHIHQRGLPAAVLAQEGQDLPLVQLQSDGVVGDHAAKSLGDPPQGNSGFSFL